MAIYFTCILYDTFPFPKKKLKKQDPKMTEIFTEFLKLTLYCRNKTCTFLLFPFPVYKSG